MVWWLSAAVLFGAFTALFAVGLPAAFAFFGIHVVGAWIWLRQDPPLVPLIRPPRRAGAGAARGGGGRGGPGVLGDRGLDNRPHRPARQPAPPRDAPARLPPQHGDGPDHGDRRRGHADPAVGADGAPRQPQRHLDLAAARGGDRARRPAVRRLRGLHRRQGPAGPAAPAPPRARGGGGGGAPAAPGRLPYFPFSFCF